MFEFVKSDYSFLVVPAKLERFTVEIFNYLGDARRFKLVKCGL